MKAGRETVFGAPINLCMEQTAVTMARRAVGGVISSGWVTVCDETRLLPRQQTAVPMTHSSAGLAKPAMIVMVFQDVGSLPVGHGISLTPHRTDRGKIEAKLAVENRSSKRLPSYLCTSGGDRP